MATLRPGQKLLIDFISERYGAGLNPVREALNRLSSEGLVERKDQRGFFVPPVSIEGWRELVKTRCWLEGKALEEVHPEWRPGVGGAHRRRLPPPVAHAVEAVRAGHEHQPCLGGAAPGVSPCPHCRLRLLDPDRDLQGPDGSGAAIPLHLGGLLAPLPQHRRGASRDHGGRARPQDGVWPSSGSSSTTRPPSGTSKSRSSPRPRSSSIRRRWAEARGTSRRAVRPPQSVSIPHPQAQRSKGSPMKLLRYGSPGQEKPGLLDQDGTIRDLSGIVPDIAGEVLFGRRPRPAARRRSLHAAARGRGATHRPLRRAGRQVHLHRPQLFRSCRRVRHGRAARARRSS